MKMPFVLDAPAGELTVLEQLGSAPATPDQLLSEYKAGKRNAVTFQATTYVHGPNRNHTRLNDPELEAFAESFKGQPFLQDHTRTQSGRGGTILDSRLVEENGKKAIRQTVKAVKPWAVEGVLDGTVDRFSIGWNAQTYECTACAKDFFACGHGLEDLGTKDKDGKSIEVLMKGLEGMEVSAVTHPAVTGTGVLDMLRQLQESAVTPHNEREDKVKEKVFSLLGLSADTSDADAEIALEQRLSASVEKIPAVMLTALELDANATTDDAMAAVMLLKAPGMVTPEEHAKTLEQVRLFNAKELVAKAKSLRKITPAGEAWALEKALENPTWFQEFIQHAPVNGPQIPAPAITSPTPAPKDELSVSSEAKHIYSQMGLTDEEYAAVVKAERAN